MPLVAPNRVAKLIAVPLFAGAVIARRSKPDTAVLKAVDKSSVLVAVVALALVMLNTSAVPDPDTKVPPVPSAATVKMAVLVPVPRVIALVVAPS